MTVPRLGFRSALTKFLAPLPVRTPRGVVGRERRESRFGFPLGGHEPVECWVYRPHGSSIELLFGFYSNFTDADLICKAIPEGQEVATGAGASIQFNGDRSFLEQDG